jgi:NADH-quinone oxidoreductase subunit A
MAYIPVLILLLAGVVVGSVILLLSHLLGPHVKNRKKDMPFECGVPPVGDAKQKFSVRFYLVAILFLLFDVEAIFFFPWAVVYKKYLSINAFILIEPPSQPSFWWVISTCFARARLSGSDLNG